MNGSILALLGLHRPGRARAFAAVTAAAFFSCWILFAPAKAACGCVFLLGLIGASFVDLDHLIIPDLFSFGLALAGLALSAAVPALHGPGGATLVNCARSEAASLLGLAIGSSLVLWLGLVGECVCGREVLGFGDVKLVGAVGAFCGWQGAVFSVFGGATLGICALALAALHGRWTPGRAAPLFRLESPEGQASRVGWGVHFPFGPMLAIAAAAYFVALRPWADAYLARYLVLF